MYRLIESKSIFHSDTDAVATVATTIKMVGITKAAAEAVAAAVAAAAAAAESACE